MSRISIRIISLLLAFMMAVASPITVMAENITSEDVVEPIPEELVEGELPVLEEPESDEDELIMEEPAEEEQEEETPAQTEEISQSVTEDASFMAEEPLYSGYCGGEGDGTNLTWAITSDGTLTISGVGAMKDYNQSEVPWYNYLSSIKRVVIGDEVTSIGKYALKNCSGIIGDLVIPDSVTSIGYNAFSHCDGISSVDIGSGVTVIDGYAFYGCDSIVGIKFGKKIANIGDRAFAYCSGITGELIIPDNVISIGGGAFSECDGITGVVIGENVTNIGSGAFENCDGITGKLIIPDSVTRIGISAFSGCDGITSIDIGAGVTNIVKGEEWAFYGCDGVASFEVDAENSTYSAEGKILYNKQKTKIIACLSSLNGKLVIPSSVTNIGEYAFYDCDGISRVVIDDSVLEVEDGAFYNCSGITSVEIGAGVSSFGYKAFSNCDGITGEFVIPDNVAGIGDYAFQDCDGINNVHIGTGVTDIGESAFRDCDNLLGVQFNGNAPSVIPATDYYQSFPSNVKLYYLPGTTGWTWPTWNGYNTICCSHKFERNVIFKPTCTLEGRESVVCAICDYEIIVAIKALGHTEVIDKGIDATCTKSGLTEGKHCSVCNEVIVAQHEVNALGHSYGDWMQDESGHWQICGTCKKIGKIQAHCDDNVDDFCDVCNCRMSFVVKSLTISQEYLLLSEEETAQLTAIADPLHLSDCVKWSSSDKRVFSISEEGLVTAMSTGTAYAKAYLEDEEGYAVEVSCRIDVTGEFLPDLTVHTSTTSVTSNIFSSNYSEIEVIFNLTQNMASLTENVDLPVNNGVAIEDAYFVDAAIAEVFTLRVKDDRTLVIIPTVDVTDAAAIKALKSSYKSAVVVVADNHEIEIPEVISVKVDKKQPTVKASSLKLESFYRGLETPLNLTSTAGKVIAVEVDSAKASLNPTWIDLNAEEMTVSVNDAYLGQKLSGGKLYLMATVEGFEPVPVTVSVSAAAKAPKLKLNPTSVTINSNEIYMVYSVGAVVNLLSGDSKVPFANMDVTDVKVVDWNTLSDKDKKTYEANKYYEVVEDSYDPKSGNFKIAVRLDKPDGALKAGKVQLAAVIGDDEAQSAKLPLTIKLHTKAPSIKLSKTSATLNNDLGAGKDPFVVTVIPTPANYEIGILDIKVLDKSGKNPAPDGELMVTQNGNKIAVETTDTTASGATYKVSITLKNVEGAKPVTLTVKTIAANKGEVTLTLSAKGGFDTARLHSGSVLLTPKYKNYSGFGEAVNNFIVSAVDKNKQPVDGVNDKFQVTANRDGTYTLKVKDDQYLDVSLKYSITMTSEIGGTLSTSKPVNLSVKQGSIKVAQDTKTVNLYKNDRYSEGYVTLSIADTTVEPIADVTIKDADKSFFELKPLRNGKYAIGFKGDEIDPKIKNGSVKLEVWLEGNETLKPNSCVSVGVKVIAFKNM